MRDAVQGCGPRSKRFNKGQREAGRREERCESSGAFVPLMSE